MRADVVIVGGGFAGGATAYWLARQGVSDVLIVERERVLGAHASGRNAALGRQLTEHARFTELAIRGAEFLRSPPPDFSDEPLLSADGSVLLGSTQRRIQRLLDSARDYNLPCEPMSTAAVVARWPLLEDTPMAGGVMFPTDGVIDIHQLLARFFAGARAGGARVTTGCEVVGFDGRGRQVSVQTTLGDIEASCVVIAAGAWAGLLGKTAASRAAGFDPILRHLHVTEPIAGLDGSAPFVWHLDDEFYVRPESGACLISACDEVVVAPQDPPTAPDAVGTLAAKLCRMAPRLAEYGVARSWACLRTFTRGDRQPLIGWDQDLSWLYWTAGLGGHGATCSAAVGQQSAREIVARLR